MSISLDCTSQLFKVPKEIENSNYWISVGTLLINKNEWKLEVGSFDVNFYSFQNSRSQCFLQPSWVGFLTIQKSKLWNFGRINNNDGDKLAYTAASCSGKIISQFFQSQRRLILSDLSHWMILARTFMKIFKFN